MGRLAFWCPVDDGPVGGIKKIYDFVEGLHAQGFDATVVHAQRDFRCSWFTSRAPVAWEGDVELTDADLLVLPESRGSRQRYAPGIPKVVLVQNHFGAFERKATLGGAWDCVYDSPDLEAIVTVSEAGRRFLAAGFPGRPVSRIHLGIDADVFAYGGDQRERTIAFMPRRRRADVWDALQLVDAAGGLDGWQVTEIDRRPYAEVAATLRRTSVFVSLSESEGFGLPPAEAMAAGCIVVGYHGYGGEEFFDGDHCVTVEFGDPWRLSRAIAQVLEKVEADPDGAAAMRRAARARIVGEYTIERERADLAEIFGPIVERLATRTPTTRIRMSELGLASAQSRSSAVKRHARAAAGEAVRAAKAAIGR